MNSLTAGTPPIQYVPVDRRLVVELVRRPDQTEGGIIIPDRTRWNTGVCRVIACGPKVEQVRRDDLILVSINIESATVRFGGRETYVAEEAHVLGVLTPAERERVLAEQLAAAAKEAP